MSNTSKILELAQKLRELAQQRAALVEESNALEVKQDEIGTKIGNIAKQMAETRLALLAEAGDTRPPGGIGNY